MSWVNNNLRLKVKEYYKAADKSKQFAAIPPTPVKTESLLEYYGRDWCGRKVWQPLHKEFEQHWVM